MNRPDRHQLHHRLHHRGQTLIVLVLLATLLDSAAVTGQTAPGADAGPTGDLITVSELHGSIDRSAQFLAGLCDEHGQFAYRVHLDPNAPLQPGYNELRHAGAIVLRWASTAGELRIQR